MKKMVIAVARGKDLDPQPVAMGFVQVDDEGDLREEMILVYKRLDANPYKLFQYTSRDGIELRIVYQEFVPADHELLIELVSTEQFSHRVNEWLTRVSN